MTTESSAFEKLLKRISPEEVPPSGDLLSASTLERALCEMGNPEYDVIVGGDVMLGGRSASLVRAHGPTYAFQAVRPLLERAPIGLANLEGPLARDARKQERNFSYRVQPDTASALMSSGINVVTLANNHLTDCGRSGVIETLDALAAAGVRAIGAGLNRDLAHTGAVMQTLHGRLGLLGYYWNRRTAATSDLPGSAMDPPEELARDIARMRGLADYVLVTFHWGVPYIREPASADREKARWAIECGADAVVSHHPHIVQAFEVYRGCPIFYSVGNFAFGSGNSHAEGVLVALRFDRTRTTVDVFPLYVKNRDPRVDYQPKVLTGQSAQRSLRRLAQLSSHHAAELDIEHARGRLTLWRCNATGGSGA
ncbi:MAG: CapA family protein [Myxococcota bacterium]